MPPENQPGPGLPYALGAYVVWGFLPLYLMLFKTVPGMEFVGLRILFTVPVCLLFVVLRRQGRDLWHALRNPRVLGLLTLTSALIGGNWLVYISAIQRGEVYAASLGYYISPLISVLIGAFFLNEHISRPQWIAVGLAAIGVGMLFSGALTTLWISLVLASTFAFYGVVRKLAPVTSLPGLTIESLILSVPAAGIAAWYAQSTQGSALSINISLSVLISLSGLVTAVPLLMFATAARRMDYSTLGFLQFLAPTIMFILGLTIFRQPLNLTQLASFIAIWCAIGVFSWDLLARRSKAARKP